MTALEDISTDDAFGLLERAISYALGTVRAATPDLLDTPTPCRDWDLGTLLNHIDDSLDLLNSCLGADGPAPRASLAADPCGAVRARATRLIGALSRRRSQRTVIACGYRLAMSTVAATGALEVAVHGWDVSRATRQTAPIPSALAGDLLGLGPLVAADARHHRLFAPPVTVPPATGAGDRLVALLGRDPAASPGASPGASPATTDR